MALTAAEILSKVDHTLLKPTATWPEIDALCAEAVRYRTATAMIPSGWVAEAVQAYGGQVKIATVIGFPHGDMSQRAKLAETAAALTDGAAEIDMVISLGRLKGGDGAYVTEEIRRLKTLCGERILKVIVETCYLTEAEKIAACQAVTAGGADFIKTSTGFGSAGATLADIALFKAHIGPQVQIKAAGGIRTREDMVAFLEAGCARLGASAAVKALKDEL